VLQALETSLSSFGSLRLEGSISAGWINVPLNFLPPNREAAVIQT
jgi:hypothetical protein